MSSGRDVCTGLQIHPRADFLGREGTHGLVRAAPLLSLFAGDGVRDGITQS